MMDIAKNTNVIIKKKFSTREITGFTIFFLFTFSLLQLGLLLETPQDKNYFESICLLCIAGIGVSHQRFMKNVVFRICHFWFDNKEKYSYTTKLSVENWSLPSIFLSIAILLSTLLFNMEWLTYDSTWFFLARNSFLMVLITIVCYFSYVKLGTTTANEPSLKYRFDIDPKLLASELTKESFISDPNNSFNLLKSYTEQTTTFKHRILWCDIAGCKNDSAKLGNKQTLIIFINELFQIKQGNDSFTVEERKIISRIVATCFVAMDGSSISLSDSIFHHCTKRKSKRKQQILNLFSSHRYS